MVREFTKFCLPSSSKWRWEILFENGFLGDERRQWTESNGHSSERNLCSPMEFHEGKIVLRKIQKIYPTCIWLISLVREEPPLHSLHFLLLYSWKILITARVTTFARLRLVVRQICNGFVPTVQPNLLSRNSTLAFSLYLTLSSPLFLTRRPLKNDWPRLRLLYSFL